MDCESWDTTPWISSHRGSSILLYSQRLGPSSVGQAGPIGGGANSYVPTLWVPGQSFSSFKVSYIFKHQSGSVVTMQFLSTRATIQNKVPLGVHAFGSGSCHFGCLQSLLFGHHPLRMAG